MRARNRSDRWPAGLLGVLLWFLQATALAVTPNQNVVSLTAAEQAWLAEHPKIRLAPDPDFPPIEFLDSAGRYQGIAADYAALIERKLGIQFSIVHLQSWDEVLEKAQRREIDMFGAASRSPQRDRYMDFTRPHIELPGVIIVRNDVEGELHLQDIQQRDVAVVSGYVWQDLVLNDYPDLRLHGVQDLKTGLKETSFGRVDALIANLATASWYIQREGITNLRVAGETGYFGRYSFATRKDWPELNRILQRKARKGGRTLLDHYGATNPAEFFAVATETFFEQPDAMAKRHQELFGVLKDYYRVDPRDWRETRAAAAGGAPEDSK